MNDKNIHEGHEAMRGGIPKALGDLGADSSTEFPFVLFVSLVDDFFWSEP
jgi:hypothetical protein